MGQYTGIHLSQGLTAVCFPVLLFYQTKPAKSFSPISLLQGDSFALLVEKSMCFFFGLCKKLIDTLTHTHLRTRFPPLTVFYLLVNVPNYSVKHCQRFAAWHAY